MSRRTNNKRVDNTKYISWIFETQFVVLLIKISHSPTHLGIFERFHLARS